MSATDTVHYWTGPRDFRPYCGTRRAAVCTPKRADVTCTACKAAVRADEEDARS